MASQAVCALNVVEGFAPRCSAVCAAEFPTQPYALAGLRGFTRRLSPRPKRFVLALLALFAFVTCAVIHTDAQASALGSSLHAVSVNERGDDPLNGSATEPAHYRQDDDATPVWEKALEAEDSEEHGLDTPAVPLTVDVAPARPLSSQSLGSSCAAWVAQLQFCPALARGPPHRSR